MCTFKISTKLTKQTSLDMSVFPGCVAVFFFVVFFAQEKSTQHILELPRQLEFTRLLWRWFSCYRET